MEKKKTVTRWLLKLNETGTIDIINREVSAYAPLNRILDEVGFYELEFFVINEDKYFCTYDKKERGINKSIVHVGKRDNGKLLDMGEDDFKNLSKLKDLFFGREVSLMS